MKFESWGRTIRTEQKDVPLFWRHENIDFSTAPSFLAYGAGRSYGDVCLNEGGAALRTPGLNRFMQFDAPAGMLRAEAGVTLAEIVETFAPRGFFIPITLGTKHVTLGGAIANDVHGKNHHRAGSFGCHVVQFELLRSNGDRLVCSASQNRELFSATIGGMGLTGLILWADIRLQKIQSEYVDVEIQKFSHLEEFLEISDGADEKFEHTAAWLDGMGDGVHEARGIFLKGNFAPKESASRFKKSIQLNVPFAAPNWLLNDSGAKIFNEFYFRRSGNITRQRQHYNPFFFPLDSVGHWSRLYGKRGFFQYQCRFPESAEILKKLFFYAFRSPVRPYLVVLKKFGSLASPGMMSFPKEGLTIALDYANDGINTLKVFEQMDGLMREVGGAVYPAKDARMSRESFQTFFPNWRSFSEWVDPKFSSNFWRRVNTDVTRRGAH